MTIGQKLAGYRKLSGMTQQQLGEYLNISAQAISKWEKDLSEPALATLRVLADLYKVSVDDLLNPESGFSDMGIFAGNVDDEESAQKESAAMVVGFCKNCGISVTEENLGARQPKVLCKDCLAKLENDKRIAEEQARRKELEYKRSIEIRRNINSTKRRAHRRFSFIIATLVALTYAIIMIVNMVNSFSGAKIPTLLIGSYVIFSFVSCLFYDCIVQEVVCDWFDKSLHLPGLIFTFDLDGFIWLIGMKLLFWILGLLFGIVTGIIGILLGLICAPFVFPFLMRKECVGIANGEEL